MSCSTSASGALGRSDYGRLVGGRWPGPAPVSGLQRFEAECLRSLHARETRTVHRIADRFAGAGERIADRKNRRGPFEELEAGEQPVDDIRRTERSSGVMDEHGIALKRRQPRPDRIRALGAAFDQRADVEAVERLTCADLLTGRDNHADG